jgi:tRNA (guanine-N7-)-methyltransferase
MRLRRNLKARPLVESHALVVTEQTALSLAGRWRGCFAADKPLHIEIGMGQGRYLNAAALSHPEHNYLGLEKRAEPLMWLLKQMQEPHPANLRILCAEAALLPEIFAPGEVDTLYLLFPDPWPKIRHAKRRLTSPAFVEVYQCILKPAGRLIFKTDGAAFYHWSCENFKEAGWRLAKASEDWPLRAGEIITNYEQRFRDLGQAICYAELIPPQKEEDYAIHQHPRQQR